MNDVQEPSSFLFSTWNFLATNSIKLCCIYTLMKYILSLQVAVKCKCILFFQKFKNIKCHNLFVYKKHIQLNANKSSFCCITHNICSGSLMVCVWSRGGGWVGRNIFEIKKSKACLLLLVLDWADEDMTPTGEGVCNHFEGEEGGSLSAASYLALAEDTRV